MIGALFFWFISLQQGDTPFKPSDEFEIKMEMSFKQRPPEGVNTVHFTDSKKDEQRRTSTAPLPYLVLHIKILKINEGETKVKVVNEKNLLVLSKKVSEGLELNLDIGFTDDVKDGINGYRHEVQFVSSEKKAVSRIIIEFDKEGNYFVNGERRGKV